MTPELTAAIAATERDLAEWLTQRYSPADPEGDAAALLAGLKARGWRLQPALDRRPASPPAWIAPPEVAHAHLAKARTAVAAKRGHRPEQEQR